MNKAVIFDFDGVIINSFEVQKKALLESYRIVVGEGLPSIEEFFRYSGDSLQNIFKKMGLPTEMVDIYRKFSKERLDDIKVYGGMEAFLIDLKNNGVKCGLCTGKDRERTIEILEKIGFKKYFDVIVCSDDVSSPKPHYESLLLTMMLLGVSRQNALMVGDAKNDILCAKAARIPCIAVTWGNMDIDSLLEELPDYLVENVKELSKCIDLVFGLKNKRKYLVNDFVVAEENCNMKCEYCLTYISQFKEKHKLNQKQSLELLKYEPGEKLKINMDSVSESINKSFDVAILKVSGGELLLIKGIQKYIEEQSKKYKVVQVLTNGLLLNEEMLYAYKKIGNICMQISIDHHTLVGNQYRTRKTKVLNRILANIDMTIRMGIPLEINCVLTDKNTGVVNEFAEYLLQYQSGVMLFPFPVRGSHRDLFYPKVEQLSGIQKIIDDYSRYERIMAPKVYLEYLLKFLKSGVREMRCSLPGLALGTFEDGTLTPCPNYWFTNIGSLLEGEKDKIITKVGYDKIYKLLMSSGNKFSECKKCFTPWETLNLYIEGILSIDELCRSPLYSFPGIKDYIISMKDRVLKEVDEYKTRLRSLE